MKFNKEVIRVGWFDNLFIYSFYVLIMFNLVLVVISILGFRPVWFKYSVPEQIIMIVQMIAIGIFVLYVLNNNDLSYLVIAARLIELFMILYAIASIVVLVKVAQNYKAIIDQDQIDISNDIKKPNNLGDLTYDKPQKKL